MNEWLFNIKGTILLEYDIYITVDSIVKVLYIINLIAESLDKYFKKL